MTNPNDSNPYDSSNPYGQQPAGTEYHPTWQPTEQQGQGAQDAEQQLGAQPGYPGYPRPEHGAQNYQQPAYGYAPQPAPASGMNVPGLVALICAVIALATCWIPFFGLFATLPAVVAIGFAIAGLVMERYRGKRTSSVTGLVLGGVGLLLALSLPFVTGMMWLFGSLTEDDWNMYEDSSPSETDELFQTNEPTASAESPDPTLPPEPSASASPTDPV